MYNIICLSLSIYIYIDKYTHIYIYREREREREREGMGQAFSTKPSMCSCLLVPFAAVKNHENHLHNQTLQS